MSFGASARPTQRVRRIGVLMGLAADDPGSQARLAAFAQGPQQAGWTVGPNIRIDYRWGAGNADVMRKHGAELAASSPDVILAHSSAAVAPLLQEGPGQIADITGADRVSDQREHDRNGAAAESDRAERQTRRGSAGILCASGPGQFGAIQTASHSLGV
jgi:hypothetical protein